MIKNYNKLHKIWAKSHLAGSPIKFVRNALVFKELNKLTPGVTLDIGCGIGDYAVFLSKRGHKVTAFDPSPFAIEQVTERKGNDFNIKTEINTIEEFYSSELFDNIVGIEVMEHIESDKVALQKIYSILKKGGSMLISVPATPFLYSQTDKHSGHYRRYSYANFKKLLMEVGFKNVQIIKYGFPVLFVYSLIRKLFLDKIFIRHFSLSNKNSGKRTIAVSKIYPLILAIDKLNKPFWSVGYVAMCKK